MTPIELALQKLLLGLGRAHEHMLLNYQRHLIDIADEVAAGNVEYVTTMSEAICNEIDK